MKRLVRGILLVLALAGFLLFFTFHIESSAPRQVITVGLNTSPWLRYSKIRGVGDLGKKVEVNVMSWSAAGLLAGVALLGLRSRIKG